MPTPLRDPITGKIIKPISSPREITSTQNRIKIARFLDQLLGDNAIETYLFAIQVMRGQVSGPARKPAQGEDGASVALIPQVGPTIRERLDAAMWLGEQRNGKSATAASVEISGDVNVNETRTVDLAALSAQELEFLERVIEKAQPEPLESGPAQEPVP